MAPYPISTVIASGGTVAPRSSLPDTSDRTAYTIGDAETRLAVDCEDNFVLRDKAQKEGGAVTCPPSPSDRIKHRCAEIAELRKALEEKVAINQDKCKRSNSSLSHYPEQRPTLEHLESYPRPRSSCSYFDWREDGRLGDLSINVNNTIHKNTYLDHVNNNSTINTSWTLNNCDMYNNGSSSTILKQRFFEGETLECSPDSTVSQPYWWPTNSNSEHESRTQYGSTYHTPTASPPCSPRYTPAATPEPSTSSDSSPQCVKRRHKVRESRVENSTLENKEERTKYYPNCDATIWLRSCVQEVIQPLSGVKSGDIPAWLNGSLIRNGPGRVQVGNDHYKHVFDGSALLHRFHFRDGQVTYQNRFLRSQSYLRDTRAQRIVVHYFGTKAHPDPCKTIMQNVASKFTLEEHFTDNAQISLYPYGDGLYALTETPFLYRVDPSTLQTQQKVDLTRHISIMTHTAHPHVDRDGTVYNIGQGVGPLGPKYHICKFPKNAVDVNGNPLSPFEQAEVVGSVSARWLLHPCYMHSFAMTPNYFVVIEQPLVVSVPKMMRVLLKQDPIISALEWWQKDTKFHLVRRDTGKVTSIQYVTETFFFLHTINAYEDRGHIVLDIAAYKDAGMLHCMFVEALKNAAYDPTFAQMFRGRPKRWVLPLNPAKDAYNNLVTLPDTSCHARWLKKGVVSVSPELLVDIGCEVPRINYEEYNGLPYDYFYAICSDVDHPRPGTLVKVNVREKTHVEWSEDNIYPSEPIFIASPGAKREDEGVVVSALLRARGLDREVCVVVLDATTFTLLGRVEFVCPGVVPKCLHGWFLPDNDHTLHAHSSHSGQDSTVAAT